MALLVIAALLGLLAGWTAAVPVANTEFGALEGKTLTLDTGVEVDRWHSVPYAKPPLGDLRWRPPEDPESWTDVKKANRLPNACPQRYGVIQLTHLTWTRYDEDCLYLNIYAPNDRSGAPYPVMVYIHGGAYFCSANIQYPGHFLAAKGVVVVTLNYRLGALGFMSTADDSAPGNYGLLDQIKALHFVNRNIRAFGGDPDKVTIFGESAGAASVGLLVVSPLTEGLFHQAITESGSDQAIWSVNHPDSHPEQYTTQIAETVNCTRHSTADMMDCLRQVAPKDLRSILKCTPGYICIGFEPVIDGPGGVLPTDPWTMRQQGQFAKVKLMSGINSDEASLYAAMFIPESLTRGFTRSEFEEHLAKDLVNLFSGEINETKADVMKATSFVYSPWPYLDDLDANREMFVQAVSEACFAVSADMQLKSHSQFNAAYSYIFGYRSSKAWMVPEWMGVPHMVELPYVFGYPLLKNNGNVRRDTGMLVDPIQWDEEDKQWADFILTLWTNFAKYGNPTVSPVDLPGTNLTLDWPQFTFENMNHARLDRNLRVQRDYKQVNIAFWRDYFFTVGGTTWLKQQPSAGGVTDDRVPLQERLGALFESMAEMTKKYSQRS